MSQLYAKNKLNIDLNDREALVNALPIEDPRRQEADFLAMNIADLEKKEADRKQHSANMIGYIKKLSDDLKIAASDAHREAIRAQLNEANNNYTQALRDYSKINGDRQKQLTAQKNRRSQILTEVQNEAKRQAREGYFTEKAVQREVRREEREQRKEEIKGRVTQLQQRTAFARQQMEQINERAKKVPPAQRRDFILSEYAKLNPQDGGSSMSPLVSASLVPPSSSIVLSSAGATSSSPSQLILSGAANQAQNTNSSVNNNNMIANDLEPSTTDTKPASFVETPQSSLTSSSFVSRSASLQPSQLVSPSTNQQSSKQNQQHQYDQKLLRDIHQRFPRHFVFDYEDLSIENYIASGGGGKIYKVKIKSMNGREVAGKFFNDPEAISKSLKECEVALRLHHRNIVQSLGLCVMPTTLRSDSELLLLMELGECNLASLLSNTALMVPRRVAVITTSKENSASPNTNTSQPSLSSADNSTSSCKTTPTSIPASGGAASSAFQNNNKTETSSASSSSNTTTGSCHNNKTRLLQVQQPSLPPGVTRCYLPFDICLDYARQIASGLAYLHSQQPRKVLHLDVKFANVLVFDGGKILKLCDLGLSRETDHSKTDISVSGAGTARFMCPEGFVSPTVAATHDVYAFGCILFVFCTSRLPHEGLNFFQMATTKLIDSLEEAIRNSPAVMMNNNNNNEEDQNNNDHNNNNNLLSNFEDEFDRTNDDELSKIRIRPHCPRQLVELCRRCIQPDPKNRPVDGVELVRELVKISNQWFEELATTSRQNQNSSESMTLENSNNNNNNNQNNSMSSGAFSRQVSTSVSTSMQAAAHSSLLMFAMMNTATNAINDNDDDTNQQSQQHEGSERDENQDVTSTQHFDVDMSFS